MEEGEGFFRSFALLSNVYSIVTKGRLTFRAMKMDRWWGLFRLRVFRQGRFIWRIFCMLWSMCITSICKYFLDMADVWIMSSAGLFHCVVFIFLLIKAGNICTIYRFYSRLDGTVTEVFCVVWAVPNERTMRRKNIWTEHKILKINEFYDSVFAFPTRTLLWIGFGAFAT